MDKQAEIYLEGVIKFLDSLSVGRDRLGCMYFKACIKIALEISADELE